MQKLTGIAMKDTTLLLANLRKLMESAPGCNKPIAAYIIPSDDAHQSEYICKRDERRSFISGFDGKLKCDLPNNLVIFRLNFKARPALL